jgi:hypothetical protein
MRNNFHFPPHQLEVGKNKNEYGDSCIVEIGLSALGQMGCVGDI